MLHPAGRPDSRVAAVRPRSLADFQDDSNEGVGAGGALMSLYGNINGDIHRHKAGAFLQTFKPSRPTCTVTAQTRPKAPPKNGLFAS